MNLIVFIIKNYYPIRNSPDAVTKLENFVTIRNHAAHRYFDYSHPANQDKSNLVLHTYKTTQSKIVTTPFIINLEETMDLFKDVHNILMALFMLVDKKWDKIEPIHKRKTTIKK